MLVFSWEGGGEGEKREELVDGEAGCVEVSEPSREMRGREMRSQSQVVVVW